MRWLMAFVLMLAPAQAGSLSLSLSNPAIGTVTVSGTISDADMATVIAWCQAQYANVNNGQASTPQGCFQVLATDLVNQTVQKVLQFQKDQAAAAATATLKPVVVTPAP